MDSPTNSTADHDLLIEVNANVKHLTTTITSYTDSNNRLLQDHEHHIRSIESVVAEIPTIKKTAEAGVAAAEAVEDKTSDIGIIRKLVYTAVGVILLAVISAIVALVVVNRN